MRVSELRQVLKTFPSDAEITILHLKPSGHLVSTCKPVNVHMDYVIYRAVIIVDSMRELEKEKVK